MKNTFCVTFLIATLFCKSGRSDIRSDGKEVDKNFNSEWKIRNIRGLVNRMSNENYFRPMGKPMRDFSAAHSDIMDNPRSMSANMSNKIDTTKMSGLMSKFEIDSGNPDVHGDIERPCQAYDTFCIRKYFAMHSKCKISGRRIPDPFYRTVADIYFTGVNATLTVAPGFFFSMNNARVAEFYIDKVTDNLVIAITFDQVRRISNESYTTYHLKGREPIVTNGFVDVTLGMVTVTAVIPNIHDLRFDRAEISSYADTPIGPLVVGPSVVANTDPRTLEQVVTFFATSPISYLEELLTTGPFMLTTFLQYNICDFGIKIL